MIPHLTIRFFSNQIKEAIHSFIEEKSFELKDEKIAKLIFYVGKLIPGMYSNIQGEIWDYCIIQKLSSIIPNNKSIQNSSLIIISKWKQFKGK